MNATSHQGTITIESQGESRRDTPLSRCFIEPFGTNLDEVRELAHKVVDTAIAARAGAGHRRPGSSSSGLPIRPHIPATATTTLPKRANGA